ncbi:MAG TPA: M28 family peptidase [Vicinamibacterales bacterium]|jgi:Peptidase family M28|nr:M28 family peptidase [Vicinamibacterales bacterium]
MKNIRTALVLALAMTVGLTAQRGEQAAGTAGAPQGGRGAYQPTLWWGDEMFPKWPYPAGDAVYADLDGMKIKGYINEITAISRKSRDDGNQYWGRITGSPYDKMTSDWVAAQFKRIGLETRTQEFTDLPEQWWPTSWEVTAVGAQAVPMKTAFPLYRSVGTNGQVNLEPVWVGMGTAADFDGRDVRGKAVIAYGFPNPGGRENTALTWGIVKRAEEQGAAALFIVLGFPGNVMNEPTAAGTQPPARMPIFMLGNQDGTALRQMIEKNESPVIRFRLAVELRTGLKTATVWGVLPGATDENIAVMAHTDSFFEGAMDNASGMATLVALAEHYAKIPKGQRRRTMTFFTTSAHHSPSGQNASIRWIHNNMKQMWAKTALLVNCEHTAQVATFLVGDTLYGSNQVSARRWFVGGSDQLKAIVMKNFKDYGMALFSRPEPRPGGELGQVFTDAPSFHIIDQIVYHTDMDTLDAVPAAGLEQSAHVFAKIIDDVNKVEMSALLGAPVTTR